MRVAFRLEKLGEMCCHSVPPGAFAFGYAVLVFGLHVGNAVAAIPAFISAERVRLDLLSMSYTSRTQDSMDELAWYSTLFLTVGLHLLAILILVTLWTTVVLAQIWWKTPYGVAFVFLSTAFTSLALLFESLGLHFAHNVASNLLERYLRRVDECDVDSYQSACAFGDEDVSRYAGATRTASATVVLAMALGPWMKFIHDERWFAVRFAVRAPARSRGEDEDVERRGSSARREGETESAAAAAAAA